VPKTRTFSRERLGATYKTPRAVWLVDPSMDRANRSTVRPNRSISSLVAMSGVGTCTVSELEAVRVELCVPVTDSEGDRVAVGDGVLDNVAL
jgi:hypothetical protein